MVKPKKEHIPIKSPISYFGGKGRLSKQIVGLFPPHKIFVDVFGGGASLLLAKRPSEVEVFNDLHSGITTFFKVVAHAELSKELIRRLELTPYSKEIFESVRDSNQSQDADHVEIALRTFIKHRQSRNGEGISWGFGVTNSVAGVAEKVSTYNRAIARIKEVSARLRRVQIENRDWHRILELYDTPDTLFALDPPYLQSTRGSSGRYEFEMSHDDHIRLVEQLLTIKGFAILMGYKNPIYARLEEQGWKRVDFATKSMSSDTRADRVESVWLNPRSIKRINVGAVKFIHSNETGRQAGARRTHVIRTKETEKLLRDAIESLRSTSQRVTQTAVAAISGVSRPQISRRYSYLFKNDK